MALNPLPVGKAIADYFIANAPSPGPPGITPAQIEALWQGAIGILYTDLETNMGVLPGTFVVTGVQSGGDTVPVTGIGGPAT